MQEEKSLEQVGSLVQDGTSTAFEQLGSQSPEVFLGQKVIVISVFLLALWLGANYVISRIKSGKLVLPKFLYSLLGNKLDFVAEGQKNLNGFKEYNLDIVQRKVFQDGAELLVMDVEGRHILLSKSLQAGITYITDLNMPVEVSDIPPQEPRSAQDKIEA